MTYYTQTTTGPVINVTDYGAAGSALPDTNVTAIRAAAADAAGVGVLFFPGNTTFLVSERITIPADSHWVGRQGSVIKAAADFGGAAVLFGNKQNYVLERLTIDGNANRTLYGCDFNNATNIRVQDCRFYDLGEGVRARNAIRHLVVFRNEFEKIRTRGIYTVGTSASMLPRDITVVDNWLHDHDPLGDPRRWIRVSGKDTTDRGANILVTGNRAFGSGVPHPFGGTADQIAVDFCNDVVVANNFSADFGELGFAFSYCSRLVVRGNVAKNGDSGGFGFKYCTDMLLSNNIAYNVATDGEGALPAWAKAGLSFNQNCSRAVVNKFIMVDDRGGSATTEYGVSVPDSGNVDIRTFEDSIISQGHLSAAIWYEAPSATKPTTVKELV